MKSAADQKREQRERRKHGLTMVMIEIDLSELPGELLLLGEASVAELEAGIISERTRTALRAHLVLRSFWLE